MKSIAQFPPLARPVGASPGPQGVSYAVWAPDHEALAVWVERKGEPPERLALVRDDDGYHAITDVRGRAGDLYTFQLPDGRRLPDPASRFQPRGVHGASECIDARSFEWSCADWQRPAWHGQTTYELHLGTFTPEGTFRAAIGKLDYLCDLGIEAIELLPLADFDGARNWGYDGVALYAPARCYGRPDDLRALIDAAHARGLVVILDVVYNHVGPAGNYLPAYTRNYFHGDRVTPWGAGFNLDGPACAPVREFVVANVAYWLDDFRFDGLRVDATHTIQDSMGTHLLAEISEVVHARGGFLVAEDERNTLEILRTPEGLGHQFDAAWSDDFHHQVRVAVTGTREAYFSAYNGAAADLADTLTHGWSYRGRSFSPWKGRERGAACDHLPTTAFVYCIENHDQVGNRAKGERLEHLVSREVFRAASMLLCLNPYASLIFMGQEWAASSPFLFFTDHEGELGRNISAGRKREFAEVGLNQTVNEVPDPQADETFGSSKLRWEECGAADHAPVLALYRDALRERKQFLPEAARARDRWAVSVVGATLAIRFFSPDGDHLLLVALHRGELAEAELSSALQPLPGERWQPVMHSEDERYGGSRAARQPIWPLTGPAAAWLKAAK